MTRYDQEKKTRMRDSDVRWNGFFFLFFFLGWGEGVFSASELKDVEGKQGIG